MNLYCTEEFKTEFDRLKKNNSYSNLEKELIDHYCNKTFEEVCSGDLLGTFPDVLYVKKRLDGRGGYRAYFIAVIKKESIYLAYVHPKTGRYGLDNITVEKKKDLLKQVLAASRSGELYEVKQDAINKDALRFTKTVVVSVTSKP